MIAKYIHDLIYAIVVVSNVVANNVFVNCYLIIKILEFQWNEFFPGRIYYSP